MIRINDRSDKTLTIDRRLYFPGLQESAEYPTCLATCSAICKLRHGCNGGLCFGQWCVKCTHCKKREKRGTTVDDNWALKTIMNG